MGTSWLYRRFGKVWNFDDFTDYCRTNSGQTLRVGPKVLAWTHNYNPTSYLSVNFGLNGGNDEEIIFVRDYASYSLLSGDRDATIEKATQALIADLKTLNISKAIGETQIKERWRKLVDRLG